jgi:deoxycytidine triphosphate deaminase
VLCSTGDLVPAVESPERTRGSEPAPQRRGGPPGSSARAGHPGRLHRSRPVQYPESNIQPASLDLRLGERALRIRCSFLPGEETVERKLKDYILDEIDLRGDGAMLEARCPYLIELKERLDLPAGLRGKANPKSSTGRIDVFTRVITDQQRPLRRVAAGYQGSALSRGGPSLLRRPGEART